MTFQELQNKIGTLIESEWHQHKNGGGWVHKNAIVKDNVFIGSNATIFGGTFYGGWFKGGWFWGGTFWGGVFNGGTFNGGTFYGGTFCGGEFYGGMFNRGTFYYGCFYSGMFNEGTFNGGIFCGGTFNRGSFNGGTFYAGLFDEDRTWTTSPLFIVGTRHTLSNCQTGHIQIGCHLKPIKWWRENFRDIGRKEGYTDAEIEEYGHYIELFEKVGK